jgi:Na+/H+ antiporter NhaC
MLKYIVFLGAVVNLLGAFLYIRSTLKGETKPNRVSRLMRAITPLIGSAAAFSDGVGWGAIPVFMS